jgi:hypothetical protein
MQFSGSLNFALPVFFNNAKNTIPNTCVVVKRIYRSRKGKTRHNFLDSSNAEYL